MTNEIALPETLRSLGQPLRVCPPRAGAGRTGYFIIATVLAVLASLNVIGIVNPPEHNPPPPVVFVALIGVLGGLALVFLCMGILSRNYTFILFPEALARTGGDAPEIFRWSDIREVYTFLHPVSGKHRIVARDGRKLEINSGVKDGRQLGEAVQQTLFDRMKPGALQAFDNGETLAFGPLRLDRQALFFKNKRLAWHEIGKMQLLYNAYTRSFQFEVTAAAAGLLPWCVVKSQDIPNLDLFKMLAGRMRPFNR